MSFGAGHVQDMINRMKQNRALRPSKRQKFKGGNRDTIYTAQGKASLKSRFRILPSRELDALKKQIQNRARREKERELKISVVVVVVMAVLLLVFMNWLNTYS